MTHNEALVKLDRLIFALNRMNGLYTRSGGVRSQVARLCLRVALDLQQIRNALDTQDETD